MRYVLAIIALAWLPLSGDDTPAWAAVPYFASPPPPSIDPGGTEEAAGTGTAGGSGVRTGWHAPDVLAAIYADAGVIGMINMDQWTPYWLEWQAVQSDDYRYVTDAALRVRMTDILARIREAEERREAIRSRRQPRD